MNRPITLDARRRRARFRAWHRGMKEMDIILGGYVDVYVDDMDHDALETLETLMEVLDRDLFKWFTGEAPIPPEHETSLFHAICAHHNIQLIAAP